MIVYRVVEGVRDGWCPIYRVFGFQGFDVKVHVLTTYSYGQALKRCDLLNAAINRLSPA